MASAGGTWKNGRFFSAKTITQMRDKGQLATEKQVSYLSDLLARQKREADAYARGARTAERQYKEAGISGEHNARDSAKTAAFYEQWATLEVPKLLTKRAASRAIDSLRPPRGSFDQVQRALNSD